MAGAALGAVVAGLFSLGQSTLAIDAQKAKDQRIATGQVYAGFLVAVGNLYQVESLPHDLPMYQTPSAALELADVNLFLYGSPKVRQAGLDLEKAVGWGRNELPKSRDEYSRAYSNFVMIFRLDIQS